MHLAEQGEGPLVVLCTVSPRTGIPGAISSRPWRQPGFTRWLDMRGYGQTDRPAEIDQYTLFHLVGDIVGLLMLSAPSRRSSPATIWCPGGVARCSVRPDRFRGVIGLSVPYRPRSLVRPTTVMRQTDDAGSYQLYFQTRGPAEAEFERDVRLTVRSGLYGNSGDAPPRDPTQPVGMVPRVGGWVARRPTPRRCLPG